MANPAPGATGHIIGGGVNRAGALNVTLRLSCVAPPSRACTVKVYSCAAVNPDKVTLRVRREVEPLPPKLPPVMPVLGDTPNVYSLTPNVVGTIHSKYPLITPPTVVNRGTSKVKSGWSAGMGVGEGVGVNAGFCVKSRLLASDGLFASGGQFAGRAECWHWRSCVSCREPSHP